MSIIIMAKEKAIALEDLSRAFSVVSHFSKKNIGFTAEPVQLKGTQFCEIRKIIKYFNNKHGSILSPSLFT